MSSCSQRGLQHHMHAYPSGDLFGGQGAMIIQLPRPRAL